MTFQAPFGKQWYTNGFHLMYHVQNTLTIHLCDCEVTILAVILYYNTFSHRKLVGLK